MFFPMGKQCCVVLFCLAKKVDDDQALDLDIDTTKITSASLEGPLSTVGAATEASLEGIPAIAFSGTTIAPLDFLHPKTPVKLSSGVCWSKFKLFVRTVNFGPLSSLAASLDHSNRCIWRQDHTPGYASSAQFSGACSEESVRSWLEERPRSLYDNMNFDSQRCRKCYRQQGPDRTNRGQLRGCRRPCLQCSRSSSSSIEFDQMRRYDDGELEALLVRAHQHLCGGL